MEKARNLVIFDFCDTLVKFQSADEFCRFVLKRESKTFNISLDRFLNYVRLYQIASKLSISFFSQKKYLLRSLKGLSKEQIETHAQDFLNEIIEKRLNKAVFERFISHIENNDVVILNSGGYEPYLSLFSRRHNINNCFSTIFKFKNNIFTGGIQGRDCLGIEKVKRMHETDVLNGDFSNVYVYSDSDTDIPIFNLATHKIVVLKNGLTPQWCQTNFEIIRV